MTQRRKDAKTQRRKDAKRLLKPLCLCVSSDAPGSREIGKRLTGLGEFATHTQALEEVYGLGERGAGGGEVAALHQEKTENIQSTSSILSITVSLRKFKTLSKIRLNIGKSVLLENKRSKGCQASHYRALMPNCL